MEQRYPEYFDRLRGLLGKMGQELEGPMAAFGQMHKQVFPDGALTTKAKELITLAICITSLCEGCIAVHVRAALRAGATRQEIADMVGTTTETAIRITSRLKDRGIIRSVRGKIIILDEDKLKLFSEGSLQT